MHSETIKFLKILYMDVCKYFDSLMFIQYADMHRKIKDIGYNRMH